jgi:hypothetical protein
MFVKEAYEKRLKKEVRVGLARRKSLPDCWLPRKADLQG